MRAGMQAATGEFFFIIRLKNAILLAVHLPFASAIAWFGVQRAHGKILRRSAALSASQPQRL
jgi:hypothetical protein